MGLLKHYELYNFYLSFGSFKRKALADASAQPEKDLNMQ